MKRLPSLERVNELFAYNPEDGLLRWRVDRHGSNGARTAKAGRIAGGKREGYVIVRVDDAQYRAHRVIFLMMTGRELAAGVEIDHINGDRSDNRWCNLRVASNSQNKVNKGVRRDCASGIKGVRIRGNRFQAVVKDGNRQRSLGTFDSPFEAEAAFVNYAVKLHGEFAHQRASYP